METPKETNNSLEFIINQKEDDLKNIINEKDKIIKNMNIKLLSHENVISNQKTEIKVLKKKLDDLTKEFSNFKDAVTKFILINYKIDSTIIRLDELSLIENTIKDGFKKTIKNYELIFRASSEGYESKDFHRVCNGKKNTLIFIKTKDGRRFGGFTDLEWDQSNSYKKGGNSFIFSLDNKEVYLKNEDVYEIGCFNSYGPDFYDFRLGTKCDIGDNEESNFFMSFNASKSKFFNNDFILTDKREFLVEDYEVYIINLEEITS
jgi:hypothetical protein